MPTEQPLAFHIGIWSDVPDMQPDNPGTFNHPGTLLWDTYALNWTWAIAGHQQTGETCFEFSHALSQNQWFYPTSVATGASPEATFLWVSIAAVYDIDNVQYPWGWISRTHEFSAPAAIVQEVIPADLSPWPPVPGSQWSLGNLVSDGNKMPLDMAFQLTTYQSPFDASSDVGDKTDK